MSTFDYKKYRINKLVGLAKFLAVIALVCFSFYKAPSQLEQIIALAGAFILGSTKWREKVGF